MAADLRRSLGRTQPRDSFRAIEAIGSAVRWTAIVVCDPEAAAARRFIGPLAGTTKVAFPTDAAWFGMRAVHGLSSPSAVAALNPGDRLELPVVGAAATFDVSVATTGGARTVRLAAASPRPVAVRIDGTLASPVIVVEREAGTPTSVAVEPRRVHRFRLAARLDGRTLRLSGSASPDTFVTATVERSTSPYTPSASASAIAGARGRFAGLNLTRLTRVSTQARVFAINPVDRAVAFRSCTLRWEARKPRPIGVRCGRQSSGDATPPIGGRLGARPLQRGTARPRAAAARAEAARAPSGASAARRKWPTVQATIETMHTGSYDDSFSLTPADLNRDGRPDGRTEQFGTENHRLLVSTGSGWTRVPVTTGPDGGWAPLPDLDGDGAGELPSATGPLITDAFAGGVPRSIDVSRKRIPSDRDLDLGQPAEQAVSSGGGPLGVVDDVTGDGRPEVVLGGDGTTIYASDDLMHGRRTRFAVLETPAYRGIDLDGPTFSLGSTDDDIAFATQAAITQVVRGRTLTTAFPTDSNRKPRSTRPIELRTVDGRGLTESVRRFSATGMPQLLDTDPVSGDALLMLWRPGRCTIEPTRFPFAPPRDRCVDQLVRVAADGTVRATLRAPRRGSITAAALIEDGPDADAAADVVIWSGLSLISLPRGVPDAPTQEGTMALWGSSEGNRHLDDLPLLAEGNQLLQWVSPPSLTTTSDGTRVLGVGAQTQSTRESRVQRAGIVRLSR